MSFRHLPLGFIACGKFPQNADNIFQGRQPLLEILLHFALIATKLSVKVLAVWGGAHGGTKDGLDK